VDNEVLSEEDVSDEKMVRYLGTRFDYIIPYVEGAAREAFSRVLTQSLWAL